MIMVLPLLLMYLGNRMNVVFCKEVAVEQGTAGIFLSLAMTVIFLPSLILCILTEIIPKISKLPKFIWRLGYRKSVVGGDKK